MKKRQTRKGDKNKTSPKQKTQREEKADMLSQSDNPEEEEDEEELEASMFPSSWVKIASADKATQERMTETLLREAKKRKTKKHCNPEGGNPNHSKETGRFSSKGGTGSWSIKHPKTSKDCDAGTYRKTGGNKKVWTSLPCGRDSDTKLCGTKNGVRAGRKKVKEEVDQSDMLREPLDSEIEFNLNVQLSDRLDQIKDRAPNFIKHLMFLVEPIIGLKQRDKTQFDQKQRENPFLKRTELEQGIEEKKKKRKRKSPFQGYSDEEIKSSCKMRYNLMTFDDFLALLNKIEAAKSAKLGGPNSTPQ